LKTKTSLSLQLIAVALVVASFAGCSSTTGYQKGARTGTALNNAADSIARADTQIEATLVALNDLVDRPQPDLRGQFRTFTSALDSLDSMARQISSQAESMKSRGAAYFDQWNQDLATIQNESIRSRSEERQNEVASRFQEIAANYTEVKTAFQPFMSDLRDVQRFLSTDLTPDGLDAARELVAKANQDAVPLRESIAELVGEFREMGVALTPAAAAQE
jgi:uncharacterized phage infection (PIP) family protein YhgE